MARKPPNNDPNSKGFISWVGDVNYSLLDPDERVQIYNSALAHAYGFYHDAKPLRDRIIELAAIQVRRRSRIHRVEVSTITGAAVAISGGSGNTFGDLSRITQNNNNGSRQEPDVSSDARQARRPVVSRRGNNGRSNNNPQARGSIEQGRGRDEERREDSRQDEGIDRRRRVSIHGNVPRAREPVELGRWRDEEGREDLHQDEGVDRRRRETIHGNDIPRAREPVEQCRENPPQRQGRDVPRRLQRINFFHPQTSVYDLGVVTAGHKSLEACLEPLVPVSVSDEATFGEKLFQVQELGLVRGRLLGRLWGLNSKRRLLTHDRNHHNFRSVNTTADEYTDMCVDAGYGLQDLIADYEENGYPPAPPPRRPTHGRRSL